MDGFCLETVESFDFFCSHNLFPFCLCSFRSSIPSFASITFCSFLLHLPNPHSEPPLISHLHYICTTNFSLSFISFSFLFLFLFFFVFSTFRSFPSTSSSSSSQQVSLKDLVSPVCSYFSRYFLLLFEHLPPPRKRTICKEAFIHPCEQILFSDGISVPSPSLCCCKPQGNLSNHGAASCLVFSIV